MSHPQRPPPPPARVVVMPKCEQLTLTLLLGPRCFFRARTSGVLFVVGVGSYLAYRLCVRLFGKDFFWVLVHQTQDDLLSKSKEDQLHQSTPAKGLRQRHSMDDIYSSVLADDECSSSSSCDVDSIGTRETFLSPDATPKRKRTGRMPPPRLLRTQPAFSSTPCLNENDPAPSSDSHNENDDLPSRLSTPRRPKRSTGVLRKPAASIVLMRDEENNEVIADNASDRCSEKEASLRLVWEGEPMWDDDGMFGSGNIHGRSFQSPAPSEFSDMSAAIQFQSLMDQANEPAVNYDQLADDLTDIRHEFNAIDNDITDLYHRSHFMQNSKELYRSVVVGSSDFASEVGSVSSLAGRSDTGSFARLRRSAERRQCQGLLDLAKISRQPPQQDDSLLESSLDTSDFTSPMTDSSGGMTSSSSKRPSSIHRSMMDSAIGTDFVSSDDEQSAALSVGDGKFRVRSDSRHIASASLLSPLEQSPDHVSIAPSERSMEWFDEEFNGHLPVIGEDGDFNEGDLDIGGLMLAACQRLPSTSASSVSHSMTSSHRRVVASGGGSISSQSASLDRRRSNERILVGPPKSTRDLMVYAREKFPNDPALIK
uniref:Uncharacterized protein n=1 Tax=Plectus sambesii TaxID=2011161 RepID=A0A914X8N8_9BILA